MGFFSAPTNYQVQVAFADLLDGEDVAAYVIGSGYGGRVAIVATRTRVLVVKVALMKLKATQLIDVIPRSEASARGRGLQLSVGDHTVQLGLADRERKEALRDYLGG